MARAAYAALVRQGPARNSAGTGKRWTGAAPGVEKRRKSEGKTRVVQGSTRSQVVVADCIGWRSVVGTMRWYETVSPADRSRDRTAPAPARCKPEATEPACSPGLRPGCRRRCRPPGPAAKHPRQARGMIDQPAQRGGAIVQRCWKRMLGRQAIVDGVHRGSAFPGQRPADGIVRVQVADHPASAVHEQHCRRLARCVAAILTHAQGRAWNRHLMIADDGAIGARRAIGLAAAQVVLPRGGQGTS